jgi:hypothetical protein
MSSTQADHFSTSINCPKCGAVGTLAWEQIGSDISLVAPPTGFSERLSKTVPYPIELACDRCGTIQEEAAPLSLKPARFGT